jgi:type II secretion system protein H
VIATRPQDGERARSRPRPCGFTLVELMVVIAIIGLVVQVVLMNMGAMIPATVLDGEAKQFISHVDWIRSEARLQGSPHSLELDLDHDRWRYVFPPERRLLSTEEEQQEWGLQWNPVDERVKFDGVAAPTRPPVKNGLYRIEFDESGATGDLAVYFRLRDGGNDIWTVQIRGLTGRCELVKSTDGKRAMLEEVNEAHF